MLSECRIRTRRLARVREPRGDHEMIYFRLNVVRETPETAAAPEHAKLSQTLKFRKLSVDFTFFLSTGRERRSCFFFDHDAMLDRNFAARLRWFFHNIFVGRSGCGYKKKYTIGTRKNDKTPLWIRPKSNIREQNAYFCLSKLSSECRRISSRLKSTKRARRC